MLRIPELDGDASALDWALAYADAGWYVGPVRAGTKNPGSVLGASWPTLTSRDPEVIVGWFAGSDHGVFLHCGRSGALVLDVDHPDRVPEWMGPLLAATVTQSTRPDDPRRGHYLFATDKSFGNGLGTLPKGWGDIRGRNGVIVVAPSEHPEGGKYQWRRTGPLQPLPARIADCLNGGVGDAESTATDREVAAFLDSAASDDASHLLNTVMTAADKDITDGMSRHDACQKALVWAMDDAAAGLYPAQRAVDTLRQWWDKLWATPRPSQSRSAPDPGEFDGMVAWAVAQSMGKTDEQLQERRDRAIPTAASPNAPDPSYTDQSLAVRFLNENREHIRYINQSDRWAVWDGKVWKGVNALSGSDGENFVAELLAAFLVEVGKEAVAFVERKMQQTTATPDQIETAKRKTRRDFESRNMHGNVMKMVHVRAPGIVGIDLAELDADPWLLNVQNGILDLRTGELGPHRPEALQTMVTAASYDPDADCPLWLDALDYAQPDPDVRVFLRQRAGSALIGRQMDHVIHIDYGEQGRNGKGLHMSQMVKALGDYGGIAQAEMLLTAPFSRHPEEMARLRGKRMVWVDELRQERRLDDAKLKGMTGGATRSARFMRENTFEYRPSDTLFLSTNFIPAFRGDDDALRRRLRVVPWEKTLTDEQIDNTLEERIEADELDGILNWMVMGCREYVLNKCVVSVPFSIANATAETADDSDPVGLWARERLVFGEGHKSFTQDLHDDFVEFFRRRWPGQQAMPDRAFGRSLAAFLRRQGVPSPEGRWREGSRNLRGFVGVGLDRSSLSGRPNGF